VNRTSYTLADLADAIAEAQKTRSFAARLRLHLKLLPMKALAITLDKDGKKPPVIDIRL
jgi:hypothetical protein